MAIRERTSKARGKFWEVYWRNPFTKKIEAKLFSKEPEAVKHNDLIKYRLKHERESFKPQDFAQDEDTIESFQALAMRYLTERKMADSTKRDSLYHLKLFWELVGNPKVSEIDKKLMKKFERLCRSERDLKQRTIHRKVSIVKSALNWGVSEGYIETHNLVAYKCEKGEDTQIVPPSPDEVIAIYNAAPPHLQRVISISFMFGLRVGSSELFKLKWSDFDLKRQLAHVPASKKNKGLTYRRVDIRDDFVKKLRKWQKEDTTLDIEYVINWKAKPVTTIKRSWKTALKNAGIKRRIRPYDLRHAFATEALAAGADIKSVAEIMGHADTSMIHKHYQHVLDKQKKAAVESLPNVGF